MDLMKALKINFLVLIAILFISSCKGEAVTIVDAGKACTFSEVSGYLLKDGEPLGNSKITRVADWQGEVVDSVITDAEGYFQMPAIYERKTIGVLPSQFAAKQLLTVDVDGQTIKFWSGVKMDKSENSEAKGQKLVINCDLAREESVVSVDGQPFVTLCEWNVVPDTPVAADDFFTTDDD